MEFTETRHIRHTFTDAERVNLANQMANAIDRINEKTDELKTVSTAIKAEIAEQEAIVNQCVGKIKAGYEMRPRQCITKVEGNRVVYIDKQNGEVVDEHEMTDDEQLKFSGTKVDAEQVIRADSEKNG